jgi:hypothetical protein
VKGPLEAALHQNLKALNPDGSMWQTQTGQLPRQHLWPLLVPSRQIHLPLLLLLLLLLPPLLSPRCSAAAVLLGWQLLCRLATAVTGSWDSL